MLQHYYMKLLLLIRHLELQGGLQLCCVMRNREQKHYRNNNYILNKHTKSALKPVNEASNSTLTKHKENKKQKVQAIVQATDQSLISREAYQSLATIEHKLPCEYLISSEKIQINKEMEVVIPIKLINMQTTRVDIGFYEEPHIIDEEIVNQMVSAIGKAGCRSIKDILKYIVLKLNNDGVLNATCSIINLRISGDGRNVGRKVKQVMVMCTILDDRKNLHFPNKHFTTVLYPGNEDYDSLKNAMALFLKELHELKEFGLEINDIIWQFNFYFSSDWKFLCICLGFNGANSKHFCPWCETSKDERGRLETNWKMTKTMEQLNFDYTVYKGHQQVPLFNKIPLDHWLIDELHVITWCYCKEMDRIKVKFQFWKEKGKGSENWNYTSLMGEDKMKVLKEFNLGLLFSPSRAIKIRELWNKFSDLYNDLRNDNTNPDDFEKSAKEWLVLFLLPSKGNWIVGEEIISGLYLPSEITPYIHVLVYHVADMMRNNKKWGLKAFSCAAVEKKNHQHVSYFFRKTLKDGGVCKNGTSSIKELLYYENRVLYYNNTNTLYFPNSQKIYIR
ncbi:hypothetical protein GLOIN_2v1482032 [Rhizophagus clarus]|uniref:Uncharacterized protein n=1 Tax=Rhizophagus clarus TaxID=94130 RepID=A0A8H3QYJ0_9GLOM|nr:hypothetical protein GLOIN_2v1482032 [Rhizophagus clarus]